MNFRQKIILSLLPYIVLTSAALAQAVNIPDANLRNAIRETLHLPAGAPITQADMRELTSLNAAARQITALAGMEYATNLTELRLGENPITDISLLAHLTQLSFLRLNDCWTIDDISPLADLTQLKGLDLDRNLIVDISPLAGLRGLTSLDIRYNQIENLSSLANLTQLTVLSLTNNRIVDVNPLANLTQLARLWLDNNKIEDVISLAHLTQLTELRLGGNQIKDIGPLANLTQLKVVHLDHNVIVDVSPLARLTNLEELDLRHNRIIDVSSLVNLTQLTRLFLTNNRIVDVSPLATLTRLQILDIQENRITDHSPLGGLSLTDFRYDQTCDMPPLPLAPRLANRDYPNVAGANWIFGQDSRIDLIYGNLLFQMHPRADGRLIGDFERALRERDDYIATNPNAVFLLALNEMNAPEIDYWGAEWPYWIRDSDGNIVFDRPYTEGGPTPGGLVDFTQPEVQDIIVQQAISISKCGLFDGIIIDGWREDLDALHGYVSLEAQLQARLNIVRRIRAATRPNFLIQVNSNYEILPHTGRYINGLSMETGIPDWGKTPEDREEFVTLAENTLIWAEENLHEPRINAIFGQAFRTDEQPRSANFQWVRLLTTLSLTHADGYAMIQHLGVPKGDDRHWYDFWNAELGQPVGAKRQLYDNREGLFIREFTNGWAVYNHSGEAQVITLPEEAQGVASGLVNTEHALANLDGEMYLRAQPKDPADVNEDGVVNILDLTIVAQALGTNSLKGDVNGDGFVNILDLVFVANAF